MAHLVESMAYVGETPWHGLGNQLSSGQSLAVWSKQAGMDWSIESSPVHYLSNDAEYSAMGNLLEFPEQKVLYRSDTQQALSVVGSRYQVVQPREVLEFYRDLTQYAGFELETAGVLKGGRKLWALARTGQSDIVGSNDQINGYLLLATACDGSMATTAQFTSVRVVCNNTLAISLKAQGHAQAPCVRVRHNTKFDAAAVKRQLGISVSAWSDFMYELRALSRRPIKPREAERFMTQLLVNPNSPNPEKSNQKAISRTLALFSGQGKGASLDSAKGTAFGLLNAVTEYVDHERRAQSADHRLDSAWFGAGAQLKQLALERVMDLV